jgi:hypothetical protein
MKIVFPYSNQIASLERIEFKQGGAVKYGDPVLVPEHPWENVLAYLYGSVVKTTIYRMWYQAGGIYVAYARSHDGFLWEKPLLNAFTIEQPAVGPTVESSDGGELCSSAARPLRVKSNVLLDLHMPSMIYDPSDRARPFKLFGFTDRGYCVAFAKDGIHFEPAAENPVLPLLKFPAQNNRKTWFSDVAPLFKDTRAGKYVAYVKTYESDREDRTRRCVGFSESDDFVHWSDPETIWIPGDEEDRLAQERGFRWADFYGLCGFNYGDGYLGLLWLFYIDHELEHGTHQGEIEVFLAASADGKSWKRFSDAPLIPLDAGSWDSGMITTAGQPLFLPDCVRIYYGGANFDHAAGEKGKPYDEQKHRFSIGLTTLRKDGFVYATSPDGRLATAMLEIKTGSIKVNGDCTSGKILIDVLQPGHKIDSFSIAGIDALEYTFRTSVRGHASVQVSIENAKLYSLEIL